MRPADQAMLTLGRVFPAARRLEVFPATFEAAGLPEDATPQNCQVLATEREPELGGGCLEHYLVRTNDGALVRFFFRKTTSRSFGPKVAIGNLPAYSPEDKQLAEDEARALAERLARSAG